MPVDTHDDIVPATGVVNPNGVETHEDIKPAMGMTAYHGSPHEFEQFDIGKIGTGEGAQAYGHGLYFAENEDVADQYRKNSEGKYASNSIARRMLNAWKDRDLAIQKQAEYISKLEKSHNEDFIAPYRGALEILKSGKEPRVGHMYEVRLNAGPEHLLDWDKPLSDQPAYQAVRQHWDDKVGDPDIILKRLDIGDDSTGRDLYEALGGGRRNPENASKALSEMGIRGIRYLDAGSRGKDGKIGSSNYVIFDPKHIQTVRRYAEGGGIKAYFMHAPHEMGERLQRAFGGAITPIELRGGDLDNEARRLILWSYATAPLFGRAEGGRAYPVAVPTEIKEDIKAGKARMRKISPQEFLNESDPLHIGKGDRHIINSFKSHIKSGDPLGPLKLYEGGHQDGRHRANAAKALGVSKVPVVDYRKADGGSVDAAQNAVDVARNLTPMGFYSAAAEAASKIPQRAPIDQILNKLKGSPNVKAEELDLSGAQDAFAGQKSVDPKDVAAHLQARLPQVQETVYGYDSKSKRQTNMSPKYEQYTFPGGNNYREVLLHLPSQRKDLQSQLSMARQDRINAVKEHGSVFQYDDKNLEQERLQKIREAHGRENEIRDQLENTPKEYNSSHWDTPNVVAHLRMADRGMYGFGDPEALHIEEVQSDWGQDAKDRPFNKEAEAKFQQAYKDWQDADKSSVFENTNESYQKAEQLRKEAERLKGIRDRALPEGPHVTSTEGWTDLALKRALMEAAKGKYKKLTWTTGEDQADRYGLDKSYSQIHYSPDTKELFAKGKEGVDDIHERVHPDALHSFIGKELAQKLLDRPLLDNTQPYVSGDKVHSLIGGQLAVEQKGMRDYYDRMIPNRLQKLVSKLDPDAKIQLYGHKIFVPGENYPEDENDWHENTDEDDYEYKKVHSLEITPKLRAAILKGLPAFDNGGSVLKRAFKVLSELPR